MFDFIGFVGSILFAVCSLPQAIQTIRTKKTDGISPWFLFLFLMGASSFTVYALLTAQYVLLPNFVGGGAGVGVVAYYKIKNAQKERAYAGK